MARTILYLKHWQVLLLFVPLLLATIVVVDRLLMVAGIPEHDLVSLQIIQTMNVIYPIVVGNKLRALSTLYGLKVFSVEMVVLVGVFLVAMDTTTRLTVEQFSVLHIFMAVIIFGGLLVLFSYPARQLKSIELGRDAGLWEYVPEIFQFLVWPLGILWLQPRLNQLAEKAAIANRKSK